MTQPKPADSSPSGHEITRVIGVWNVFQFEAATIARQRAQRLEIRHFAERVWLDHALATERLLSAAGHELVPTSLDKYHQVLLEELTQAPDDEFEPLYIAQQQSAAVTAFGLLDQFAEHGEHHELQEFCRGMRECVVLHGDLIAKLTAA